MVQRHPTMNLYLLFLACIGIQGQKLKTMKFPDGFKFGVGTSAYQIEGAWNEEGKGENIWDRFTHQTSSKILDSGNADVACDSYHKYAEDVALLKQLGVDYYRFSISWSRVLPKGFAYSINKDGVRYYNNLIDLLLHNNITPVVTMYHWDTPQPISELGGFGSALVVDWFEDYARVLFENFGDRVKLWVTFNAPFELCKEGFGLDLDIPADQLSGYGDYMCGHNVIKAHARVYHMYRQFFKTTQKGKIGITISSYWYEPATNSVVDQEAAQRALEFKLAWFADPIFLTGDYPKSMKDSISSRSKLENFDRSRLPAFAKDEIDYIQGTADFFALNHYSAQLAADVGKVPIGSHSYEHDLGVKLWYDPAWRASAISWLKVVPWGFRKLLKWIKHRYGDVEILVSENGYGDLGETDDQSRIYYFKGYLGAMLDAVHEDKVNVTAFTAWSLLDNFEWKDGYKFKFGLYHVDFSDPVRPRTPKASAQFYKEVIANRTITVEKSCSCRLSPIVWLFLTFSIVTKVFAS